MSGRAQGNGGKDFVNEGSANNETQCACFPCSHGTAAFTLRLFASVCLSYLALSDRCVLVKRHSESCNL
eukprot:1047867-Amphidinium_carterae.2